MKRLVALGLILDRYEAGDTARDVRSDLALYALRTWHEELLHEEREAAYESMKHPRPPRNPGVTTCCRGSVYDPHGFGRCWPRWLVAFRRGFQMLASGTPIQPDQKADR